MLKRWLMSAFEASFGGSERTHVPLPRMPRTDYRAVSIVPRLPACRGAEERLGQRFLLNETPRMPLYDCSMPGQCRCKFKMHEDRRRTERRSPSVTWPRMKVLGLDRRRAVGRRGTDIKA